MDSTKRQQEEEFKNWWRNVADPVIFGEASEDNYWRAFMYGWNKSFSQQHDCTKDTGCVLGTCYILEKLEDAEARIKVLESEREELTHMP